MLPLLMASELQIDAPLLIVKIEINHWLTCKTRKLLFWIAGPITSSLYIKKKIKIIAIIYKTDNFPLCNILCKSYELQVQILSLYKVSVIRRVLLFCINFHTNGQQPQESGHDHWSANDLREILRFKERNKFQVSSQIPSIL